MPQKASVLEQHNMSPFFISSNMKANGGKYITFNLYEFLLFPKHEVLLIA